MHTHLALLASSLLNQSINHSIMASSAEPQSIVHKVIRMVEKNKVGDKIQLLRRSSSTRSFRSSVTSKLSSPTKSKQDRRYSTTAASTAEIQDSIWEYSLSELLEVEEGEQDQTPLLMSFETIRQNDFVEKVLMDVASQITFIVHFFNDASSACWETEKCLAEVLFDAIPSSEDDYVCYRINSQMAPYFTSRLRIDPNSPSTLLQLINGQVTGRLTGSLGNQSRSKIQEWLMPTNNGNSFSDLQHEA